MANPEHVEIVKQGNDAIEEWQRAHPDEGLGLSGADLRGANFQKANLRGTHFGGANLTGANFKEANLILTKFYVADLKSADFALANLTLADFSRANLSEANLSGANLWQTKFSGTELSRTDFESAACGFSLFADCDLSEAVNLDKTLHEVPSTIGIDTIVRSGGNIPEEFLRGAGVPEEIIRGLSRLIGEIQYHSCFIDYGEPNREFAERLHEDLTDRKLSCWVYSMDYTPGEYTQMEIKERRQGAGKFVALCSVEGLLKDGVLKEIEDQMDEDREKIIPISLDKTWKAEGFPVKRGARDLKPFLLERNYANFEEGSNYKKELNRLLKALERKGL